MKAKKILVPIDFSAAGHEALELATSLARDSDGEILIVYVEETPPPDQFLPNLLVDLNELRSRLQGVVPTDPDVPCEHKLLMGTPAAEIVDLAASEKVDLIVMPTHGRRGLSRLLMGSVAESVLRRSPCPVLTIRQSVHRKEEAVLRLK